MCINLFTNSVGPILLYYTYQHILKLEYIYLYNSKCIVQDTKQIVTLLYISKVMVLYIFNTNFI